MPATKTSAQRHRRFATDGKLSFASLSDREWLTVVIALRVFQEGWENELQSAAAQRRAPCLRAHGQDFDQHELLSLREIDSLCRELIRARPARIEERWTIVPEPANP